MFRYRLAVLGLTKNQAAASREIVACETSMSFAAWPMVERMVQ